MRKLRKRGDQQKLADRLGTYASVISRWTRGQRRPCFWARVALRNEVNIPVSWWEEIA